MIRFVQLNDEEEELQRGLLPPMSLGGAAPAGVVNEGSTAMIRIAPSEVVQRALGGAVEVHAAHRTAYGVLADGLSSVLPTGRCCARGASRGR